MSAEALDAAFAGARFLLTGCTGFFGHALLEHLSGMRQRGVDFCVTVVTRNVAAARAEHPFLRHDTGVRLLEGDVRTVQLPQNLECTHLVHGATSASQALADSDPLEMYETIVNGTRHVLAEGLTRRPKRVLFVSSGAVYGPQPPELTHVPEAYPGAPDPMAPSAAYGCGKRAAEHLARLLCKRAGVPLAVARPFAFLGPKLPRDRHFAAGQFLADALAQRPIKLDSDGSPVRSYMSQTDLATWLLTVLALAPDGRAYNVGSERAVTLEELAQMIAARTGTTVRLGARSGAGPTHRYVPSTARARDELGLTETASLEENLDATLRALRG